MRKSFRNLAVACNNQDYNLLAFSSSFILFVQRIKFENNVPPLIWCRGPWMRDQLNARSRYTRDKTTQKNADILLCPGRFSNSRSSSRIPCLGTAPPLWSANLIALCHNKAQMLDISVNESMKIRKWKLISVLTFQICATKCKYEISWRKMAKLVKVWLPKPTANLKCPDETV
jgi:hypothetical protein